MEVHLKDTLGFLQRCSTMQINFAALFDQIYLCWEIV